MNFAQAVSNAMRQYFTFSGRARRSEFWWFELFLIVTPWVITFVTSLLFGDFFLVQIAEIGGEPMILDVPNVLFGVATFIPSLAVAVRRLHDTDRTGWWLLITFTVIGIPVLIVWFILKGTTGPNRFGPDPLHT